MLGLVVRFLRGTGSSLAYPVQTLSGGSFATLLRRAGRLRRLAGDILRQAPHPGLPVRLQVETTDLCDFRCIMCTREVLTGMNSTTMELDFFIGLVEGIDPFYVTLNGLGEPLTDGTIFDKLRWLHERGIVTSMPTNGTYIGRDRVQKLADNLPDVLQLSADGGTKQSFESVRVLSDFEQVVENYRAILSLKKEGKARVGTRARLLFVMQRCNMFDYDAMYRLIQRLEGLDEFCPVVMYDYDPAGSRYKHAVPAPEEVDRLIVELDERISPCPDDRKRAFLEQWRATATQWKNRVADNQIDPATNTAACTVPWFSSYVDAKGRVYPCCYLLHTDHVMGNVHEQPLAAIWHNDAYVRFRHHLITDRPHLHGCDRCPRDDSEVLRALRSFRALT